MEMAACQGLVAFPDNSSVGAMPALTRMFNLHVAIHECVKLGSVHSAFGEPVGSHVPSV